MFLLYFVHTMQKYTCLLLDKDTSILEGEVNDLSRVPEMLLKISNLSNSNCFGVGKKVGNESKNDKK